METATVTAFTRAIKVQTFVPDMCAVGIMIRDFPNARDWLQTNPQAYLAVTPGFMSAWTRGEDDIDGEKPEFAALLRSGRERLFADRGLNFALTSAVKDEITELLSDPSFDPTLRRAHGFEMRMEMVAAARAHDLTILSGNLFFRELAKHIAIPRGVYDILRQRWVVPNVEHN